MNGRIPWTRVNDFLLHAGAAWDQTDFHRRVLAGMARLIPFDGDGMCLRHSGQGRDVTAVAGEQERVRECCQESGSVTGCPPSSDDLRIARITSWSSRACIGP
jgi:hypothetical protein